MTGPELAPWRIGACEAFQLLARASTLEEYLLLDSSELFILLSNRDHLGAVRHTYTHFLQTIEHYTFDP